jgi:inosine-uridine nucleoside N-ribohydrolase
VLRGQVEVLGLTTIFGNVTTPMATANALHLCEMAARTDVPVAQARIRARQRSESALGV